jgi:uncharacterized caspase-like protein
MNRLHFGVAVGINRYPDIRHLRLAKGDAEAFARWLSKPDGGSLPTSTANGALIATGHVATVVVDDAQVPDGTNREDAKPIRKDVFVPLMKFKKAVEAHVAEHPEDWVHTRLYVYVSGHGIAPQAKDAAILLADAGPDWFGENISCAQLLQYFMETQPFHEVVIFADCCRERIPNAPLGGLPWEFTTGNNGNVVSVLGCATYFGDLAYEPPIDVKQVADDQRGYFTKAVLEGLEGSAADPAGAIDSTSLAKYVRLRVLELTKHKTPSQTPTMEADPADPVVFRAAPGNAVKTITHRVRIIFPPGFKGTATLRDGTDEVLSTHTAGGVTTIHLPNGLYSITPKTAGTVFQEGGLFRVWGSDRDVQL